LEWENWERQENEMAREKPLAVGTELKGRYAYVVKRLVGGGGMAWVYQVERRDNNSTSLWALKELRPQTEDQETQAHARALFDQEATILAQLDHPNLPEVIDFFEEAGRAYLVMEFIWGVSLEKRLEQAQSPLMERQVLQWAVQISEVLDYLHNRQPPVIFRDLKPSNIMVSNAGVIKLVDFGIARTYKENKLQDTIALGSENYAAPEQWGQAQTDARADIYGLGATMYHLLANMPPSPAFLPTEPTSLDALNAALSAETVQIVSRAMARDRTDRYQTAEEMQRALLACLPNYISPIPLTEPTATAEKTAPQIAEPSEQTAQQPDPPGQQSDPSVTQIREPTPGTVIRRIVRRVKVCPRCKHRNALEARFCVKCGRAFVGLRPAVLRVIEPVRAAWEMPVAKSPLLFGRARPEEGYRPDFDMSFYDPEGYISRRHGQIIRARNGYFVVDLGSSNGTYVNDRLLPPHKPQLLRNGDRVAVGEVMFQFLLR
jgi:serine/threonine protein kinase